MSSESEAARLSVEAQDAPRVGVKRKPSATDEIAPTLSKRAAKRLKKRKASGGDVIVNEAGEDEQINAAIARMDGPLMGDYLARQTKRFEKDLSIVELEDLRVPAHALADATMFDETRTLENLPPFLEKVFGKTQKDLQSASKKNGSPHTIVVTAAGLRAADITRVLRMRYRTEKVNVAKLFAKHIKLKDAVESLGKTRMNIGVGTPQRLIDLAENGALSLDLVKRVVIDASHVNQKKQSILDMRETLSPLMRLLALKSFKQRYDERGDEEIKIVVF